MSHAARARAYHEQDPVERQRSLERILSTEDDPGRRLLVRGAAVVTMDPDIGTLACGDLLVEGPRILAVAPDLGVAAGEGALVLEAGGMVAIPGMVDAHRHCWQNQFRRLLCDVDDLTTYVASTHGGIALHYQPRDMYVGNLVTMLGALDSGVTTILDFSHNSRSAAHSDAAVSAYREAGIRAVHASAPPNLGEWDRQWPTDVPRLAADHGSHDHLVTVRMGIDMRPRPDSGLLRFARDAGLAVTVDGVMGPGSSEEIVALARSGDLGPDVTFIHCTGMTDDAWRALADTGARVTLAPTSDEQIGIADGVPPVQACIDHGIRPSLSVDVEITLSTDMFSQMRAVLCTQRMHAAAARYAGGAADMVSTADVLAMATVQGAADVGLGAVTGSLTPGKQADLVLLTAEEANNLPLTNAVGTAVLGCDSRNVDTVLVDGRLRKWAGQLVGADLARVRALARESRDRIAAEAGFTLAVEADGRGFPGGSQAATTAGAAGDRGMEDLIRE